jgi:uncharacterized membrane protein required for colicin V production
MLDLILIVILIGGFLIGLKRGLILGIVHLTGFIIAFAVAYLYFDDIAPRLRLWIPYPAPSSESAFSLIADSISLEEAYYRAIAFAVLFFGTKILMQVLGSMLDFLADLPLLRTANKWMGGALGFVEVYLIVFLFLYFAALVPTEFVQQSITDSFLAQAIVEHTPVFSERIKDMWFPDAGV